MTDAWISLKQRTEAECTANPGYTFDTSTNAMTASSAGCTIINRIDRLFYTADRITPTSMNIIGTKPYAAGAWPRLLSLLPATSGLSVSRYVPPL
jgi:hypothetical protein